MRTPSKDPLLSLPPCVSKCDVCGHEPVDIWLAGFGCDHCRGREAVRHACELSWGKKPEDAS